MNNGLILVPFLTAFFGWLAGTMALKLFFYPVKPKKILGFQLQGILPARKQELVAKLGKLVSNELLSSRTGLEERIADPANFQKIMPFVETHIDQFLRVRLVEKMPMIGMLVGERTILEMKALFTAELEALFPVIMKNYMDSLQAEAGLEAAITDKIRSLPFSGLENTIAKTLSKEIRYLGFLGGVAGLIVGLVEVFILLLV